MLKYTGHPFVDVGIAAITAFAGKREPEQVTIEDLDSIADYIEREYVQPPLNSFLTVAFPNSGFTQPAYSKQPKKRQLYANRVLRAYVEAESEEKCVFTGEPAAGVPFDVKGELPPGRVFRQHVPLLTGEDAINFHPYGDAGVPVSGKALLAIQALPLGCAKCGGRLLAVHSDNPEITLHFAAAFLQQNRRAVQLAKDASSTKLPEARFSERTLLIDVLLKADELQREARENEGLFSLTAYHFTNSGQGADLDIYHLPMQTIGFLREMYSARYAHQWNPLVCRAWEEAPKGKKDAENFEPRKNWLYEDLFDLPQNTALFIRTYFLRTALRHVKNETDPRTSYSLRDEVQLVSWSITDCFLRRILGMEKERVAQIRQLGDALADYVAGQNDRRFFRNFFTEQRYDYFRTALIKANLAYVRSGKPPFITLDPYIAVFEEGEGIAQNDWRLARDLVLIRMIEQLYQRGWFQSNVEVLTETSEETAPEEF